MATVYHNRIKVDRVDIYARESEQDWETISKELQEHKEIWVHADYETFYGWGFHSWLKEQLKSLNCTCECIENDYKGGFPRVFHIKLNN